MKILLIESDDASLRAMRTALEARGLQVVATPDGKEGLELAHSERPSALVLAVELGDKLTGGYAYCNKLKKDDELKSIPLVLISSQATPETFEQHRKLKTRAEEYLIKPFSPQALIEKLALHVAIPAPDISIEEVSLEADGMQVEEVDSFEIDGSPEADDEDSLSLDKTFAGLSREAPGGKASEPDDAEWALDALVEMPGATDTAPAPVKVSSTPGPDAARSPGPLRSSPRQPDPAPSPGPSRALRAVSPGPRNLTPGPAGAESTLEIAELKGQIAELESRVETLQRDLEEHRTDSEAQARRLESDLARKDTAVKTAQARADVAQAQTRKLEATLAALKSDTSKVAALEDEVAHLARERDDADAGRQAAEARVTALEAEGRDRQAQLKTDLESARRDLAEVRSRSDSDGDRLRARVAELESDASRNEERVVKAYQKIKGDERVKEKTKKALAIALQLLEEQAMDEEART